MYEKRTQNCDYIASLIINILQKLIINENSESLIQSSATVKSVWFAITQYHYVEENHPFHGINHEKIKRKLVTTTYMCLNKMFTSGKKIDELFDVKKLLIKLMNAVAIEYANTELQLRVYNETDHHNDLNIKLENLNVLSYSVFLIVQYLLINRSDEANLFESIFDVLQANKIVIGNCLSLLIKIDRKQRNEYVSKILNILFKLIYFLSNAEKQQEKLSQKNGKTKRHNVPSISATSIKSYKLLKCTLESFIMSVAQKAKPDRLRTIFGFFRKHFICYCNINFSVIQNVLKNSLKNGMHKICLNFIKHNILKIVLFDNVQCLYYDTTDFVYTFKENFVVLYKSWFSYLTDEKEILVFLKHIAKISKYIHVDIQLHILGDIVLKTFRSEKQHLIERTTDTTNKCLLTEFHESCDFAEKIIISCLNIFLCYLKDVTVIKAFFIEENIQDLADLLVIPQFAYLASNLLKIGVDCSQFLGETGEECQLLCHRIEAIQLQLFADVMDILVSLFNDMSTTHTMRITQKIAATEIGKRVNSDFHLNFTNEASLPVDQNERNQVKNNDILAKLQSQQLSISDVLHLSVIYWNLILQIIQSSNDAFQTKVKHCIALYTNLVMNLMYNSLSCVLSLTHSAKDASAQMASRYLFDQLMLCKHMHQSSDKDNFIDLEIISVERLCHTTLPKYADIPNDPALFDYEMNESEQVPKEFRKPANIRKMNECSSSLIYNSPDSRIQLSTMSSIIQHYKNGNSAAPNYNYVHLINRSTATVASKQFQFSQDIIEESTNECQQSTESSRSSAHINQYRLTELNTSKCKKLLVQLFEISLGIMLCENKGQRIGKYRCFLSIPLRGRVILHFILFIKSYVSCS